MSDAIDFARSIEKRLDLLISSNTKTLVKADASRHDRLCGFIEALEKIREELHVESRKWTMRQEEDIDA